ncbi:MAG: acyltransferase [Candidatus Hodarchaeales archaeon]
MARFIVHLLLYILFSIMSLTVALAPLSSYIYLVIISENLLFFLSFPIGIPLFWIIGFFLYVLIHSKIAIKLSLPKIKPGTYPIMSDINKTYSLRLSADNLAKYWVKSLEWIPFFSQLFLLGFMLRQYGVKIGKRVYFATETRIDGIPLIEIGDECFIGPRAIIGSHINLRGGNILYKPSKIGKRCFIGHSSVLTPGANVGDDAILGAYSVALLDTVIPSGETWVGLPARPLKKGQKVDSEIDE